MATFSLDTASAYFETRLSLARQANQAPPEVQFDLARSPLSDDELEAAVDKFRDTPQERIGWGISSMLQEVLSTEPATVPVSDLKALQTRLVQTGYVSPDMEATGQWDDSWYSGLRRAEWDQKQKVMSGHHWGAVDLETGLRALAYMLPASVLQGVVGAAKGIVAQTGETFERGGALGGAAAGAAIGGSIGTVAGPGGAAVGAVAGGAIGAAAGFLSDIFGEDEGEKNQDSMGKLIDALTPFEEYSRPGGPQAFFEDLGYVLTAATMARGIGLGVQGTKGAVAAVGAARAEGVSLGKAMLMKPGKELGIMGSLTKTVASKALPGSAGAIENALIRTSPFAFAQRLGPQVAVKAFSGLAQAQMGARLFGGLGGGGREKFLEARAAAEAELGRDLTFEESENLREKTSTTTIEHEVTAAPDFLTGINADLPGTWGIFGMDLSNLGDLSNLAAFVIYPERMLPFTGKATRAGINSSILKLSDDSARTIEYAHAYQFNNPKVSFRKAVDWARENISPHQDAYMRVDFGLDRLAQEEVRKARQTIKGVRQGDLRKARADQVKAIRSELDATGQSETLQRAMLYSATDPTDYGRWLIDLDRNASGPEKLKNYWEVSRLAKRIESQAKDTTHLPTRAAKYPAEGPVDVRLSTARTDRPFHGEILAIDTEVRSIQKELAKVQRATKVTANSPAAQQELIRQTVDLQAQLTSLRLQKKDLMKLEAGSKARVKRTSLDNRIGVATLDFVDRDQLFAYAQDYKDLVARRAAAEGPQRDMLNVEFRNFLEDLEGKGLIEERTMLDALKREDPGDRISAELIEQASSAARPLKLRQKDMEEFRRLGYKPVEAGDDFIFPDQIEEILSWESYGGQIADVSKLAGLVETAGFSLRERADEFIGQYRRQTTLSEIKSVFDAHEIKLSPEAGLARINATKESLNHGKGMNIGPITVRKSSEGGVGLYKVDIRDLSLPEVELALDGVTGATPEVAKDVFAAIRRGAALGGEFTLKRPGETMHLLGRALRTQGFVGFSDVVRTMSAKVPDKLVSPVRPEFTYTPKAELARSPQRARTMRALDEVQVRQQVAPQLVDFEKMKLDALAEGQVASGRWASVDDFYRDLDVGYADEYVAATQNMLFKKVAEAPEFEDLKLLARAYKDEGEWYQRSADALANLPLHGKTTLANGKVVNDTDLFAQFIAATSPRVVVEQNVKIAWEAFKSMKRGDDTWPTGIMSAPRGMLDDIMAGRTIDTWGPPIGPGTKKTKVIPRDRHFAEHGRYMSELSVSRLRNEDLLDTGLAIQYRVREAHGGSRIRDKAYLDDLKKQIARDGITEPLLVEVRGDKLSILDGTHRAMIAEELGLENVPVQFNTSGLDKAYETYDWLKKHDPEALKYAPEKVLHGRPKVWNFYHNLMGQMDHVTVDGWMAKLFGHNTATGWEYDDIANQIKRVSEELGWKPAQTQAALWAGIRDEASAGKRVAAQLAEDAGDLKTAKALRREAAAYDESSIGQYTDRILKDLENPNPYALMQRLQEEVAGTTSFGPDFPVIMRFFRKADFSTLVHEDAHLLRKLLAPEDVEQLERFIKAAPEEPRVFTPTPVKVGKRFDELGPEIHSRTIEGGGATWDPHTGRFVAGGEPGAGFAVAVEEGTGRLITPDEAAFSDPAAFTAELKKFARAKRAELEDPRIHIGTWKDDEGIHLDLSEVASTREEALRAGAERKQKAVFDLEKFEDVPVEGPGVWTREMEEKFAHLAERYFNKKLGMDPPRGIAIVKDAVGSLYSHVRQTGADTNLIPREARQLFDKYYPDAVKAIPDSGAKKFGRSLVSKQTIGGAAVGAVTGAVEGDDFTDVIQGAVLGAGAGLAARSALKRTYGYLPDYLTRVNSALRYTLSFTFDMGRYIEQNQIGYQKYRLTPMVSPKKFVTSQEWPGATMGGRVSGDAAWKDATQLWEEINGTNFFQSIDDIDRRMFQRGMLGFSPRNFEIAQAYQLHKRGMGREAIKEAIAEVSRYGLGRTAAEKSANFIFFPFSFSKKMLTGLGDFVLQAPGRNLLIQEGLRRYHESEFDEGLEGIIQKHFPLLEDLKRVNNLAFGISPGRFFLEGLRDHRTGTGWVAQVLASAFVPSGAATPITQAAGGAADVLINAFTPVVLTGESFGRAGGIDGVDDIIRRYIPFVREVDEYLAQDTGGFRAQLTAFMEGAAPDYQYQKYVDGIKAAKEEYRPMATALGYASVDGFLSSPAGAAFQQTIEERKLQLGAENPTGLRMASKFETDDRIDAQAMADLADKHSRGQTTKAEEQILAVREEIERWEVLAELMGLDASVRDTLASAQIRKIGEKYAGDRRFAELWDRFFLRQYGPIRRIA